jgi:hypothetical protein
MPEKLAPGVYVYSYEQIANSIDIIKKYLMPYFEYGFVQYENTEPIVNINVKKVKGYSFQRASSCHEEDPINIFKKNIKDIAYEIIDNYRGIHSVNKVEENHEWEILQYEAGGFFTNHIDDGPTHPRTLSIILYFNDDYEGGEIEFPNFNVLHKPKAGEALIFPSSFIYNHNIKVITAGTRYAAVNFFSYTKPDK